MYRKGLEMLRIFKNHTLKTSLLDDFVYYENRQKIMEDEKAKVLIKNFGSPLFVPALEQPRKMNFAIDIPPTSAEKNSKVGDDELDSSKRTTSAEQNVSSSDITSTSTSVD